MQAIGAGKGMLFLHAGTPAMVHRWVGRGGGEGDAAPR